MAEQNRVQWVYSSQNNQELAERYDQWAEDYDVSGGAKVDHVGG